MVLINDDVAVENSSSRRQTGGLTPIILIRRLRKEVSAEDSEYIGPL